MTKGRSMRKGFGVLQILPLATAAMAALFFWLGMTHYGFWHDLHGPLSGFVPVVVSAALFAVSVLAFVFSFGEESPSWPRENWLVPLGALLVIAATFVIGLIPSVAVYLVVWLRWYEKCGWKTTLITFAAVMAIVLGCFVLWLQVPFPQGLILDLIANRE